MALRPIGHPPLLLTLYRENSLWELVSTETVVGNRVGSDNIKFYVHLRRKSFYCIVNIVTPIIVLSLMTTVVFWLPPKADEKMSLCVTIFLSFTIFSALIFATLPESSDSFLNK
jgi:hypothetical protein